MSIETLKPMEIEKKSFEIIGKLLEEQEKVLCPEQEAVIKRVIHTTADLEYAEKMYFSSHAISQISNAFQNGADIVTDTQMAKAGINKALLASFGGQVHCFMSDNDVAEQAKLRGVTRAVVSMEKACRLEKPLVFAIGNAPTALIRLCELMKTGRLTPAGVIGVPVGFVNVVESKELLMQTDVPSIITLGRKGGSNIAAAVCNALLYQLR